MGMVMWARFVSSSSAWAISPDSVSKNESFLFFLFFFSFLACAISPHLSQKKKKSVLFFSFFDTGSHHLAQAGLELPIFLPQLGARIPGIYCHARLELVFESIMN
jgi:hypothetical protein